MVIHGLWWECGSFTGASRLEFYSFTDFCPEILLLIANDPFRNRLLLLRHFQRLVPAKLTIHKKS